MPGTKKALAYKRVLLKLSGEALLGEKTFGIDRDFTDYLATEIKEVHALGVEIAAVVGGGNIFRGVSDNAQGMDRVSADHMGMLATVINALALQDALERAGVFTRVLSAIEMQRGRRALHPPPRHAPHGEGPGGRSSPPAPATPTSPPTPPPPCGPWRSRPRSSSRPPRSTASTTPTP